MFLCFFLVFIFIYFPTDVVSVFLVMIEGRVKLTAGGGHTAKRTYRQISSCLLSIVVIYFTQIDLMKKHLEVKLSSI